MLPPHDNGTRGCSAVGSATRSHRVGQGFDSPQLHQRSSCTNTAEADSGNTESASVALGAARPSRQCAQVAPGSPGRPVRPRPIILDDHPAVAGSPGRRGGGDWTRDRPRRPGGSRGTSLTRVTSGSNHSTHPPLQFFHSARLRICTRALTVGICTKAVRVIVRSATRKKAEKVIWSWLVPLIRRCPSDLSKRTVGGCRVGFGDDRRGLRHRRQDRCDRAGEVVVGRVGHVAVRRGRGRVGGGWEVGLPGSVGAVGGALEDGGGAAG